MSKTENIYKDGMVIQLQFEEEKECKNCIYAQEEKETDSKALGIMARKSNDECHFDKDTIKKRKCQVFNKKLEWDLLVLEKSCRVTSREYIQYKAELIRLECCLEAEIAYNEYKKNGGKLLKDLDLHKRRIEISQSLEKQDEIFKKSPWVVVKKSDGTSEVKERSFLNKGTPWFKIEDGNPKSANAIVDKLGVQVFPDKKGWVFKIEKCKNREKEYVTETCNIRSDCLEMAHNWAIRGSEFYIGKEIFELILK